jgi:argininosuccinate lyase
MDAVGSRDHVAEFLFAAAMHGVHLSRLCEEIILWASRQFRWIELDDSFATGSSIMPQKKNPDIAEIARGRSARLIGDLASLLVMLKGLPLTYNRDMMEDKAAAFDAVDGLAQVQPALSGMVHTMKINAETLTRDSVEGFTLATEIADWLSRKGVPFATAHEITGAVVRHCEERKIGFDGLAPGELAKIDARLDDSLRQALTPEAAIAARGGYGGTAASRVQEQLSRLLKVCGDQRAWCAGYKGPRAPIR